MTAEIAICNANGIALAADSAVSMFNGQKIYNSANKLFSLSKHHPVAVMVYNSASLMSVPWEIAIKQYRSQIATKSFLTLQEYCDDFWAYVESQTDWFTEDEERKFVRNKISSILSKITDTAIAEIENQDSGKAAIDVPQLFERLIQAKQASLDTAPFADGFTVDDIQPCQTKYGDIFASEAEACLENAFAQISDIQKEMLYRMCATSLTKAVFEHYSGVVIAGFGAQEITPKIACYEAGIFCNGKLRKRFNPNLSNTQLKVFVPSIYPFAQDDVVRAFIAGIDPEIDRFVKTIISSLPAGFHNVISEIDLAGTNEIEKMLARANIVRLLSEKTNEIIRNYDSTKFELGQKTILQMLSYLPKDELAEMAEALISLTAFKRRMSATQESVGGPIDVAILSKGDGFIWIKRKHYFKPELNQQFFHNYFNR